MEQVLAIVINFVISGLLGYSVKYIQTLKKKSNASGEALLTLLQNNLTNTYFVYENLGKIPDYVYKNWLNLLKAYENLGGDDYVHILAKKMEAWELEKTDILGGR